MNFTWPIDKIDNRTGGGAFVRIAGNICSRPIGDNEELWRLRGLDRSEDFRAPLRSIENDEGDWRVHVPRNL